MYDHFEWSQGSSFANTSIDIDVFVFVCLRVCVCVCPRKQLCKYVYGYRHKRIQFATHCNSLQHTATHCKTLQIRL